MDLNTILLVAAALACPVCMGVMMWMMNKNMGSQPTHSLLTDLQTHASATERLAALYEQHDAAELEMNENSQRVKLEDEHEILFAESLPISDNTRSR